VIARKVDIEAMLQGIVNDSRAVIEKGKYLVIGTLDRVDWRAGQKGQWSPAHAIERAWLFRNHWDFVVTGGWQLPEDRPRR
jgi:hypothetical protein